MNLNNKINNNGLNLLKINKKIIIKWYLKNDKVDRQKFWIRKSIK